MVLNYTLKALHDDRSECYGEINILGYRNNSGHLEASGNNRLGQTTDWDMFLKTPDSLSAHALRTRLGMLSGPVA